MGAIDNPLAPDPVEPGGPGNMPEGGKVVTGNEANPPMQPTGRVVRVPGGYEAELTALPGANPSMGTQEKADALADALAKRLLTPHDPKALDTPIIRSWDGAPKAPEAIRIGDVVEFTPKDGPAGQFVVHNTSSQRTQGDLVDQVLLNEHGWVPVTLVRKVVAASPLQVGDLVMWDRSILPWQTGYSQCPRDRVGLLIASGSIATVRFGGDHDWNFEVAQLRRATPEEITEEAKQVRREFLETGVPKAPEQRFNINDEVLLGGRESVGGLGRVVNIYHPSIVAYNPAMSRPYFMYKIAWYDGLGDTIVADDALQPKPKEPDPALGDLTGTPAPSFDVSFNAQITDRYDVVVKSQGVKVAWIRAGTDTVEFMQDPTKDQLMGVIYHLLKTCRDLKGRA